MNVKALTRLLACGAAGLLLSVSISSAAGQASFDVLGDLSAGAYASAGGVSADGSVVVGRMRTSQGYEAFRWTASEGMVGLGDLPGREDNSGAHGVSADGSTVVGSGESATGHEAFLWTAEDGMIGLGTLGPYSPGSPVWSYGQAVSGDGSVVVGYSSSPLGTQAFRRTRAEGMVGLGAIPGELPHSWANAVSYDGSIAAGECRSGHSGEAVRWHLPGGGIERLGRLPGGSPITPYSWGQGCSPDGSIVVGRSTSDLGEEAFIWTESDGMVSIGDLPGGTVYGDALDVSADGSIVVGRSHTESRITEAFIWDAANGMRSLKDVLTNEHGLELSDWHLSAATSVSDDGRVIVGAGRYNPTWVTAAWRVVLVPPSITTTIDVRPGAEVNPVNRGCRGVLRVAVHGSEEFDTSQVDLSTLELAGAGPRERGNSGNVGSFLDVNGDSFLDLVLQFDVEDMDIGPDGTELTLFGSLVDGTEFEGTDSIRIVPSAGGIGLSELGLGNLELATRTHIPEPAALSLLALGGLAATCRRRK